MVKKLKPEFYDFIELFEKNIIVDYIASELVCWNPKEEEKQVAIKKMKYYEFDLLPIINEDGKTNQYLTQDDEIKNIEIDQIISDSMSLTYVINLFRRDPEKKLYFVKFL